MFDRQLRDAIGPGLEATGRRLAEAGVRPGVVTAVGWLLGVGACVAAATGQWNAALVLWLANRLLDGLDGPVARATSPSDVGGFLDIMADFSIYGGFVVAVAIAEPGARLACGTLLLSYYVSGTAFLALSSLLERRGQSETTSDRRSLRFVGGLAEGAETIVVYVLFCLFPHHADIIAWVFAGVVAVTALQRVLLGVHLLKSREGPAPTTGGRPV
jgi:phosphatidylglycerophosphate synthase